MELRVVVSLVGALCLVAPSVLAGNMGLAWDAVSGASGYRVYYGTSAGQYNQSVDVGNTTTAVLNNLQDCRDLFVAVKAYNASGESAQFSNEVDGWSRPEVASLSPGQAIQGSQFTLSLFGANYQPGAQLVLDPGTVPVDIGGNSLVQLGSAAVISCNEIEAIVTLEPSARGFRAMPVGNFAAGFRVTNPDNIYGDGSETIQIQFDSYRADINRSGSMTVDRVDGQDLVWLEYAHGTNEGDSRFNADADLNGDGMVDGTDLALLAPAFGQCWNGSQWDANACP